MCVCLLSCVCVSVYSVFSSRVCLPQCLCFHASVLSKFYAEAAEPYADKIVPEAEVRVTCARVCMCVRTSHCGNIRKSA